MKINTMVKKLIEEGKIDKKNFKLSIIVNNEDKKKTKFETYNYRVLGVYKVEDNKMNPENLIEKDDLILLNLKEYDNIKSSFMLIAVNSTVKVFNEVNFYDYKVYKLDETYESKLDLHKKDEL